MTKIHSRSVKISKFTTENIWTNYKILKNYKFLGFLKRKSIQVMMWTIPMNFTHYFGHLGYLLTTCVHVPKKEPFFMRKVTDFILSKTLLRKVIAGCSIGRVRRHLVITLYYITGMIHLRRLPYSYGATMSKG
jgi:hypothetical protein